MKETCPSKKSKKWSTVIWVSTIVVIVMVLAGLAAPMVIRSRKDPLMGQYFYLNRFSSMLWNFAAANDGRFPKDFEELSAFLGTDSVMLSQYHSPKTGVYADWLYFAGFDTSDRPETIVLASPVAITEADGSMYVKQGASRMILTLDGRSAVIKESDYQQFIAEQSLDSWRKPEQEKSSDPWDFLSNPAWSPLEIPDVSPQPSDAKIKSLLSALKNGVGMNSMNAADELAEIGPISPEIVPALLDSLGDPEAGYECANLLASMSLTDHSIPPRLVEAMDSQNPKKEYWAAVALEQIGLKRAKNAIPLMADALSRRGDQITITAAKALAGAESAAATAVPQLLEVVTRDGDDWDRKCAIIALGRIGPEARPALPALLSIFRNGDDNQLDAARAICKIDPSKMDEIIPFLIEIISAQRVDGKPNRPLDHGFFFALDLLADLGPAAKEAIPALILNLLGGARIPAAWALVQIDPTLKESHTDIIASVLFSNRPADDRIRRLNTWKMSNHMSEKQLSGVPSSSGLMACGMLWQLYPERRGDLSPVLLTLLREWREVKGLSSLSPELRKAIPALEGLLEDKSVAGEYRRFAMEALQEIRALDPGHW
jgi:hypothetical protein